MNRARRPMSGSSGPPTTTRRTRPASRACSAGSTSRPTTSRVGSSGRNAGRTPGPSRSGCTAGRAHDDRVRVPAGPVGRVTGSRRRILAIGGVLGAGAVAAAGWVVAGAPGRSTPSIALGAPHFVEETATAGLVHAYDGPLPFFVGGGVAVFDCDDDGRPEAFVAGGVNQARLFHNDSAIGGALRFSVLDDPAVDLTRVNGAYPLD